MALWQAVHDARVGRVAVACGELAVLDEHVAQHGRRCLVRRAQTLVVVERHLDHLTEVSRGDVAVGDAIHNAAAPALALDARAARGSRHVNVLERHVVYAAGALGADRDAVARAHANVAEDDVAARMRVPSAFVVPTTLHAKRVVADRKVAVLDERIRHAVKVDAVGVGRVSWVDHRNPVHVQVGHCTKVNVPVRGILHGQIFYHDVPRLKNLNDARARETVARWV